LGVQKNKGRGLLSRYTILGFHRPRRRGWFSTKGQRGKPPGHPNNKENRKYPVPSDHREAGKKKRGEIGLEGTLSRRAGGRGKNSGGSRCSSDDTGVVGGVGNPFCEVVVEPEMQGS